MANVNKIIFIGRLTRDPEGRTFQNGGKLATFGFAVSNRKLDQATGEWVDDPMFIDVKAFNAPGEGRKLADMVMERFQKGKQFYLEGRLIFEQWVDGTTGQKRSKHTLRLTEFQFLEPRQDGTAVTRQTQVNEGPPDEPGDASEEIPKNRVDNRNQNGSIQSRAGKTPAKTVAKVDEDFDSVPF